jgi:hypothetical protein
MRISPNNNEIAAGVKAWFATLNDQDKQTFLATACMYLTTFARQSTKIEELQGLNELQDCLYQAIAMAGRHDSGGYGRFKLHETIPTDMVL